MKCIKCDDTGQMPTLLKGGAVVASPCDHSGNAFPETSQVRYRSTRRIEIEVPAEDAEASVKFLLESEQLNLDVWEIVGKRVLESGRIVFDCYRVPTSPIPRTQ